MHYHVNWICILCGPEDDSIGIETCSPRSMVIDMSINRCVRLLHLVP